MPALSSAEGMRISHAPSLVAFQSSLVHQHCLLWLDTESKRLYCIVVKSVSSWGKNEIRFTGSFRFLAGASVTWQNDELGKFYADLDDMSKFEATYDPENMTATLFVDKGWLNALATSTAAEDDHGVVVPLESITSSGEQPDEADLRVENDKIMSALAGASDMFVEYVRKLESSRLDIAL